MAEGKKGFRHKSEQGNPKMKLGTAAVQCTRILNSPRMLSDGRFQVSWPWLPRRSTAGGQSRVRIRVEEHVGGPIDRPPGH